MSDRRRELAAFIDHTLLTPEATFDRVGALCAEAQVLGVHAVCVSPTMVGVAARRLCESPVNVVSVIGFPSGAHRTAVKAAEARRAVADGADEFDMVMNLGLARAGDWGAVRDDIGAVREVLAAGQVLKVILETAVLTREEIIAACEHAEAAGADFVKSSTGFHPAGGVTLDAVATMAAAVGGRLGVKAAGGIHDARTAWALIDTGATRLGLSSTAAILSEVSENVGSV
ncbi:MAG: deoxyribose-phosphate aldolase [Solirubrobacteraceae bacterium]